MTGRFELRDHPADVAVAAEGDTLGEVFAAVADGLTAAMCDDIPETGERFGVAAHAESTEALLFEYLDELIYQRDVRNVLPAAQEAEVHFSGEYVVEGSARGVPLDQVAAREVKAVTYSEMRLEETGDGREAHVVFDV
jgi:SHS2 domain-containing protein